MVHARSVGDGCLIGIHATLLSGAVVGEYSLIAANALIREDQVIPPRSIVVGVPGKVIGQTDEAFAKESVARACATTRWRAATSTARSIRSTLPTTRRWCPKSRRDLLIS
jgi:carbonic anhydrase/acetyltransferase-like protein (isoleucine patch superfamily)